MYAHPIGSCLFTLFLSLPLLVAAQENEPDIEYELTQVTGNIYLLNDPEVPMADNVVGVAGKEGVLLIDSAFKETLGTVQPLVQGLGGPVRFLINTHFHHAGANEAFGGEATVVAHRAVRDRMTERSLMYGQMPIGPWPEAALPDIVFDSTVTLHFNGEAVRLIHFPHAHTDGDVIVHFTESNVVATGDVFVPGLGVCDLQNGGVWATYLDSIDRLLRMIPNDARIIPGHGPVSSYDDLAQVREMLRQVTGMVRRKMNEGKSREEIISDGLPERWKSWGKVGIPAGFFLENVYRGLATD